MIYLDTSAAAKVLLPEPEQETLRSFLTTQDAVCSSVLLRVELFRLVSRLHGVVTVSGRRAVEQILGAVPLVPIERRVVSGACELTGGLRSLDAIHLATALMLDSPADPITLLTYDARLGQAAREHDLEVIAPGV